MISEEFTRFVIYHSITSSSPKVLGILSERSKSSVKCRRILCSFQKQDQFLRPS